MSPAMRHVLPAAIGALCAIVPPGCTSPPVQQVPPVPAGRSAEPGERQPAAPAGSPVQSRPVAMANGEAIEPRQLEPRLKEAAGADVLEELILETALREELRRRGMGISAEQVRAEEGLLRELIVAEGAPEEEAMAAARRRRGLGPVRWEALLWRNAALRALVAAEVRVPSDAAERLHDARHGERRIVRIIAVRTPDELAGVQAALGSGDRFESVAMAMSVDASATLGGLVGPVSRGDASIPAVLREAVFATEPGELTTPVMLPTSIVIARVDRALPPDGTPLEGVRPALEREALLRAQRAAMEALAARLRAESRVTVLDAALDAALDGAPGR